MKKLMFVIIAVFSSLMFSCSESTVNPNDSKEQKEINLTKNVWVLSSFQTSKFQPPTKMKFNRDRSFKFLDDGSKKWQSGTWTFDNNNNILLSNVLSPLDSTFVFSVDENKLIIKETVNSLVAAEATYIPEVLEMSKLTITGNITFDPSIINQDLTGAQVCILWFTPDIEKNMKVYGIGTIDAKNKTFSIEADSSFPISLFTEAFPDIDGYFNMGYICLIWNENLKNGQIIGPRANTLEDYVLFGCVEDRAIHFIQGDYKKWSYNNMWHGDFIQGYNFCKGWYDINKLEHDGWQVDTSNSQINIKVSGFIGDWTLKYFKFPNWG